MQHKVQQLATVTATPVVAKVSVLVHMHVIGRLAVGGQATVPSLYKFCRK